MNPISSFEAEARELLAIVEAKLKALTEDHEKRIAPLTARKSAIEETLRAYKEERGAGRQRAVSFSSSDLKNMTHIEILKSIARGNNGILLTKTGAQVLRDLNVLGNPHNASAIVHSRLARSTDFERVGQGAYKLLDESAPRTVVAKNRRTTKSKHPTTSGILLAVRELKEGLPSLTREQILDILQKRGFDFKGKNPVGSVRMAWVRLGYHRVTPTPAPTESIGQTSFLPNAIRVVADVSTDNR
jgi:hypothetical protein